MLEDFWSNLLIGAHVLGAALALRAAATAHTAQGAVAWAMSLVAAPYLALPLYALFGPPRLDRRNRERREAREQALALARACGLPVAEPPDARARRRWTPLERLAPTRVLDGAEAQLLIDGRETFDAMFDALDAARNHASVQFFIIRDDGLGQALKDKLVERARAGVAVRLLYDNVGSRALPRAWFRELAEAGVETRAFKLGRRLPRLTQLNYRNHRKVVAADGRVAIIGGPNVGDEYLGLDTALGPWRDTAIRLTGAAASAVSISFLEDWIWAGGDAFAIAPEAGAEVGCGCPTLILPTGPADRHPSCTLTFCHLIAEARRRLWIATPYFVPDLDVFTALKLAALRGVDVRVLIPDRPDHWVVWLAGFAYAEEARRAGIAMWRYRPGFMHQKVMLIDDWAAGVGTANLDNRSLRLNFEITALVFDRGFAGEIEAMLEDDFDRAFLFDREAEASLGPVVRLLSPAARLLGPLL